MFDIFPGDLIVEFFPGKNKEIVSVFLVKTPLEEIKDPDNFIYHMFTTRGTYIVNKYDKIDRLRQLSCMVISEKSFESSNIKVYHMKSNDRRTNLIHSC